MIVDRFLGVVYLYLSQDFVYPEEISQATYSKIWATIGARGVVLSTFKVETRDRVLAVIVMTFWYVYSERTYFFRTFFTFIFFGIDHDPPCSL